MFNSGTNNESKPISFWAIACIAIAIAAATIAVSSLGKIGLKSKKADARILKRDCKKQCKYDIFHNKKKRACLQTCYAQEGRVQKVA